MDTLIFVFQNRDNLLESFLKYYILHKGKTRDLPHVFLQNRLIEQLPAIIAQTLYFYNRKEKSFLWPH